MPANRKQPKATTSPSVATIVPRMLNAADAARYLGVGTFALRGLHWESKLRGVFIGRRLLFDRNDLDKYVDALKRTTA